MTICVCKKIYVLIAGSLFFNSALYGQAKFDGPSFGGPLYFCAAADTEHYAVLVELIGSINAFHGNRTGQIAVFDLGFKPRAIALKLL